MKTSRWLNTALPVTHRRYCILGQQRKIRHNISFSSSLCPFTERRRLQEPFLSLPVCQWEPRNAAPYLQVPLSPHPTFPPLTVSSRLPAPAPPGPKRGRALTPSGPREKNASLPPHRRLVPPRRRRRSEPHASASETPSLNGTRGCCRSDAGSPASRAGRTRFAVD